MGSSGRFKTGAVKLELTTAEGAGRERARVGKTKSGPRVRGASGGFHNSRSITRVMYNSPANHGFSTGVLWRQNLLVDGSAVGYREFAAELHMPIGSIG